MKIDFVDKNDIHIDIDKLSQENAKKRPMYLYKLIQSVSNACEKNSNKFRKLFTKHEALEKIEPLTLIVVEDNQNEKLFSKTESKKKFKTQVLTSLLEKCCQLCQNDHKELIFFAAATFNLSELEKALKQCTTDELNQTRYSDSAIIFALKYGDISHKDLFPCMKKLVDAGVDVNKFDITGRFAIDYAAALYNSSIDSKTEENLVKAAQVFMEKNICLVEDTKTKEFIQDVLQIDLATYKYSCMNTEDRLFLCISKNKEKEFLKFKKIRQFVNCNNGEYTLLQLAANKSPVMLPVVEYLLKNGADPNQTTEINPLTPLEIAGRNNYEAIFRKILSWKDTRITEEQFNNFVTWRGRTVKRELFGIFLESDKIDPTFVFKKTGNRPLHYAIRLVHKNAIQKLLKRPDVSLTKRNNAGKCPLDILNAADLNIFLDSCLVFDSRRTIDFNSTEYKMQFRFRRLTDGNLTEVDVISRIGKYQHLTHLLTHPLIHTYIMLKWFKVKFYFWAILMLQAFLFSSLSVCFYRFPFSSRTEHFLCFILSLINIICKAWIFLNRRNLVDDLRSKTIKPFTFYVYSEIMLMIILIGSFWLKEFRAFVFVLMAVVFLLTAGYHPTISHWSIMIQTVFTTFTKLLFFFSLLMISFAAAFHIMFEDHRFFTALYRSVFMSYFMTIGEINVGEVDFETTPFGGYLLFFLFAMSMSVVIINFWTGVAIKDIDKFEKRSEINGLRNVIAFIRFIEKHVYNVNCLKRILPNPLLFPNVGNESYVVDFYVNKDDHFEYTFKGYDDIDVIKQIVPRRFPKKLDDICFNKIRAHYYKHQNNTVDQNILNKLNKILQGLEILKEKLS